MGSKTIVILGLMFLATVLLISSEVAARDLAETETSNTVDASSKETEETNAVSDTYGGGHGGGRGGYGGGRGGYGGGRGGHGGGHGGYGGGRGGHGGGRCRYGCCGRSYKGGCRCCSFAGEKPGVAEP